MNRISYSGIRQFCNCRRAFKYRYHDNLESIYTPDALTFGKGWHALLEEWYRVGTIANMGVIKDPKLYAMMRGYERGYCNDNYKIKAIELPFEIKVTHPDRQRAMRGVRFRGFIDLVIERDDQIWIVEHKTAAQINGAYIDRLWHDLQIMLYAYAYGMETGRKVTGIIYNVLVKSKLKQSKGETEAEFDARLAGLIAKSKTGKSSAKRKMPETDEAFLGRLVEQYKDPSMYHREEILCDKKRLGEVQVELWEAVKEMRSKNLYKNRAQCFMYNRECEFFKICNSSENKIVIENYYREREKR